MIITFPERLVRETIPEFTSQIISTDGTPLYDNYSFDFESGSKEIEPIGVTILHSLVTWLLHNKKNVDFQCVYYEGLSPLPDHLSTQKYLDDCGFFEGFIGNRIDNESELQSDIVTLQDVMLEDFHHWLTSTFIPWLSKSLNKSPMEVESFKACLEEVFNNVRDHSYIDFSNIFAQYYPDTESICIAIGDIGIGIIEHIKSFPEYRNFTDEEALRNAVKRNFTTRTTPKNRGAGLDMLIYNVVKNAGGSVYILSNRGILESRLQDGEIVHEYKQSESYYPGTHIEIKINVSEAANLFDNVEEEFSW